eukprot:937961-Prymnesium_polylepis.1
MCAARARPRPSDTASRPRSRAVGRAAHAAHRERPSSPAPPVARGPGEGRVSESVSAACERLRHRRAAALLQPQPQPPHGRYQGAHLLGARHDLRHACDRRLRFLLHRLALCDDLAGCQQLRVHLPSLIRAASPQCGGLLKERRALPLVALKVEGAHQRRQPVAMVLARRTCMLQLRCPQLRSLQLDLERSYCSLADAHLLTAD